MWKLAVSLCLLTAFASSNFEVSPQVPKGIASVLKNQKHKCLGVIVDNKFVVTSAHCVLGSEASSLSISYGSSKSPLVFTVQKVIVHPYYMPPSPDYNIALLKTKLEGVTEVLDIGKTEPLPKDDVQMIYWDPTNSDCSFQSAKVIIEDRKSCRNKVGKFVSGRMICANDENPSLKADGPLIFDNKLIGVPSKRIESNQGVLPAIYTNIANSEIYSFIESYV